MARPTYKHRLQSATTNSPQGTGVPSLDRQGHSADNAGVPSIPTIRWSRLMEGRHRWLVLGAWLLAGLVIVQSLPVLRAAMRQNDFSHYYAAGRLAWEGHNPYRTGLAPMCERLGLVYDPQIPVATNPPPLVWLTALLAMWPLRVAFGLWLGVQLAGLAVILWLTRRLLGDRLPPLGGHWLAVAAIVSGPVQWNLAYSQVQLPLAALVLAAFDWRRRGRERTACAAVTVACLLKLYPVVLLPWFVWRGRGGWRGMVERAAVCGAVALAGWCVTGPGWWRDFFAVSTVVIRQWMIMDPTVFSVPSLVAKYGSDTAAQLAGLGLIIGGYAWCAWGHGADEEEFALLTVVMLLAGWVTWAHYLVFLIFPFTLLVIWVARAPTASRRPGVACSASPRASTRSSATA